MLMKKMIAFCLVACLCTASAIAQTQKVLRHMVLFKFKETATPANIKEVVDAFGKLPSKIKFMKGYEAGLNNSPEKLNDGFTHCFTATFKSEKDRDNYLVYPAHKEFVKILGQYLDKALVVDYWTK